MSGIMMTFPETVEEFMESYKIVDTEKIYTNGTELVPIFRMRQWFAHLPSTERRGKWREIGKSAACVMVYCSVCGDSLAFPIEEPYNFKYCPFCGAHMED